MGRKVSLLKTEILTIEMVDQPRRVVVYLFLAECLLRQEQQHHHRRRKQERLALM
jgi:hypothetical protein